MPDVMPEPIKLKLKYRANKSVKQQKSPGGQSGKNKRNKLNQNQKKLLAPQPKKTMRVDGFTGHSVIETVE